LDAASGERARLSAGPSLSHAMGVESEGEEERVELDDEEVAILEKEEEGGAADDDGGEEAPGSDEDEEDEDEEGGGAGVRRFTCLRRHACSHPDLTTLVRSFPWVAIAEDKHQA
jgi:hypothetical protein